MEDVPPVVAPNCKKCGEPSTRLETRNPAQHKHEAYYKCLPCKAFVAFEKQLLEGQSGNANWSNTYQVPGRLQAQHAASRQTAGQSSPATASGTSAYDGAGPKRSATTEAHARQPRVMNPLFAARLQPARGNQADAGGQQAHVGSSQHHPALRTMPHSTAPIDLTRGSPTHRPSAKRKHLDAPEEDSDVDADDAEADAVPPAKKARKIAHHAAMGTPEEEAAHAHNGASGVPKPAPASSTPQLHSLVSLSAEVEKLRAGSLAKDANLLEMKAELARFSTELVRLSGAQTTTRSEVTTLKQQARSAVLQQEAMVKTCQSLQEKNRNLAAQVTALQEHIEFLDEQNDMFAEELKALKQGGQGQQASAQGKAQPRRQQQQQGPEPTGQARTQHDQQRAPPRYQQQEAQQQQQGQGQEQHHNQQAHRQQQQQRTPENGPFARRAAAAAAAAAGHANGTAPSSAAAGDGDAAAAAAEGGGAAGSRPAAGHSQVHNAAGHARAAGSAGGGGTSTGTGSSSAAAAAAGPAAAAGRGGAGRTDGGAGGGGYVEAPLSQAPPLFDDTCTVRALRAFLAEAGAGAAAAQCSEKGELLRLARDSIPAWEVRRVLCCARAAADAREAAATAASQGDMLAQGSALGSLRRAHMAALRVDSQSGPTVKKAFRELSLRVHPDKNVEADEALAKEAFQFLQAAHAALVMLANR